MSFWIILTDREKLTKAVTALFIISRSPKRFKEFLTISQNIDTILEKKNLIIFVDFNCVAYCNVYY